MKKANDVLSSLSYIRFYSFKMFIIMGTTTRIILALLEQQSATDDAIAKLVFK